jgi:hypothetical protein
VKKLLEVLTEKF